MCKFKKVHVFGALNDVSCITKMTTHINAKKYLPFLRRLKKKHGKLCIIVDNARWHLTKKVFEFVKKEKIVMIRLPPYSPELNPIEQYWKNIKQHLAMRPISTKDELIKEVKNALQRDIFVPKNNYY